MARPLSLKICEEKLMLVCNKLCEKQSKLNLDEKKTHISHNFIEEWRNLPISEKKHHSKQLHISFYIFTLMKSLSYNLPESLSRSKKRINFDSTVLKKKFLLVVYQEKEDECSTLHRKRGRGR